MAPLSLRSWIITQPVLLPPANLELKCSRSQDDPSSSIQFSTPEEAGNDEVKAHQPVVRSEYFSEVESENSYELTKKRSCYWEGQIQVPETKKPEANVWMKAHRCCSAMLPQRIDVDMARAGTAFCLALMAAAVPPAAPAAVRAVISDVDGTLMAFASNSQLSRRNQAALSRAQAAGCLVSVATGRIPGPWYRALCSQLPDLGPGVFCNGALVMEGDTVLHASALPPATVAAVVGSLPRGRVLGKRIGALAVVDVPGDGSSLAKAAADVVVAAHTDDGVAEAIERYVL
eukprot:Skav219734  [mRNA]  locus=scaffold301:394706:406912:- [translate_table: standard]